VRYVFDEIRTNQRVRRGEIGVFAQTITPALAAGLRLSREWGVVLGDVYPNSPAAKAGLRVGDVILAVDGKPLENGRQFDVTLYSKRVSEAVALEVARGLQRTTIRVPLVERRDEDDVFRDLVNPEQNLVPRLGILGLDMTPELARMVPGVRQPYGVLVAGTAAGQGTTPGAVPGDIIYAVNGTTVKTLPDLRMALGQIAAEEPAVLQVGRKGQLRYVVVTLEGQRP
jgi:serine protease Do